MANQNDTLPEGTDSIVSGAGTSNEPAKLGGAHRGTALAPFSVTAIDAPAECHSAVHARKLLIALPDGDLIRVVQAQRLFKLEQMFFAPTPQQGLGNLLFARVNALMP